MIVAIMKVISLISNLSLVYVGFASFYNFYRIANLCNKSCSIPNTYILIYIVFSKPHTTKKTVQKHSLYKNIKINFTRSFQ